VRQIVFLMSVAALAATEPAGRVEEIKPRLPALASVYPQGSRPGETVRVEVLGQYLDRAQSVVFLDPGVRGRVIEGDATRLSLELTAGAEAAYGPHYFRVVSPRGASNILLFRIGDLPHVAEAEPNSTLDSAQRVSLPATINGRLNVDDDFDFFRFRAEKGSAWIFDLRSARNGSGLDPALILLDSRGRKLEHSEDVFLWDPFFSHTFDEAGEYIAVVQPTHGKNDPGFAYQLDIRQAPHLETVSPIALRPGAAVDATLFGAGLAGESPRLWFDAAGFSGEIVEMRGASARVRIRIPSDAREGEHRLAVITAAGRSNPAAFLVDATPAHPGGDEIRLPVSITGIARYRQAERFWFQAKEGDKLVFEVRAQRYGSPVDSILRILDAAGKEVAKNDDANFPGANFNKDSQIVHTFREAGRYQIEMRNLWKTTGEDFPYQLIAREARPSFELMLASDHPYVYAGGDGSLKISAVRKEGHDAPIPVKVEGLPPGITADAAGIPPGKDDVEIRLHASSQPGVYAQVRAGDAWKNVRISSGGGEGATFAPVREATLAVIERPRFSLEADATNLILVRGGAVEFKVMIERARDFSEPLEFSILNLPRGVAVEPATAPGDAREVRLKLRAAPDAAIGRATRLAVTGRAASGEIQYAPKIGLVVD
jgi:hypothetical protein